MLPIKDVAQQPPEHNDYKKHPGKQRSIQAGIQSWIAGAATLGIQAHRYPGNSYQQQGIIPESARYISVQQRMDGPLASAAGTLIPRELQDGALRKQPRLRRIQRIINQAKYQQQSYNQQDEQPTAHIAFITGLIAHH